MRSGEGDLRRRAEIGQTPCLKGRGVVDLATIDAMAVVVADMGLDIDGSHNLTLPPSYTTHLRVLLRQFLVLQNSAPASSTNYLWTDIQLDSLEEALWTGCFDPRSKQTSELGLLDIDWPDWILKAAARRRAYEAQRGNVDPPDPGTSSRVEPQLSSHSPNARKRDKLAPGVQSAAEDSTWTKDPDAYQHWERIVKTCPGFRPLDGRALSGPSEGKL